MANIVVDLTPVLPGGANGGAKPMVLELIKQLGEINTDDYYVLLTSEAAHAELASLDAHNIRRLCVSVPYENVSNHSPYFLGSRFLRRALNYLKRRISYRSRRQIQIRKTLQEELKPDLLFCPFTAPFFAFPKVPVVSIVYDLQFLEYPNFFSVETQIERLGHFKKACEKASRLICISEFTRQSVLKNAPFPIEPERVIAIPIHVTSEWTQKGAYGGMPELLKQYDLVYDNYLLYPANFWKHKNHKILLTAFALYRAKYPHSSLRLVCTGAPETGQETIRLAAESMHISDYVVFPGYVNINALFGLMSGCKALIFPSLYEGFGIPVVEAMLLGKPILCSRSGSLLEVGGETALYFHPGKPKEIVSAIEKVDQQFDSMRDSIVKGYKNALQYLGSEKMARAYSDVFDEAIQDGTHYHDVVHGIFEDGWTSDKISLTYAVGKEDRMLSMTLHCPLSHPKAPLSISVLGEHLPENILYSLVAGETLTIQHSIPRESGHLDVFIKEVFQPSQHNMGGDVRGLGCVFQGYSVTPLIPEPV